MKRKTRNAASKQWQTAIKKFLNIKSEELNSKPKGFFKMFKPLLANRNGSFGSNYMLLNVNGTVAKDQNVVVKEFAGYFSTLANDIGDESSLSSTEHNFTTPQV